jgi:transposase
VQRWKLLPSVLTRVEWICYSAPANFNSSPDTDSDIIAPKWRNQLLHTFQALPPETNRCTEQELKFLDFVQAYIDRLEVRILERIELSETSRLLKTLPAVGKTLSIVIEREVGSIDRFPSRHHFASFAGTSLRSREVSANIAIAGCTNNPTTT